MSKRSRKKRHEPSDDDEVTPQQFVQDYIVPVVSAIQAMAAELEKAMQREYKPPPGEDPQAHIVRLWAGYLGKLISSVHQAAMDLTLAGRSVAAGILVRQVFEYFVKLHYLVNHPEEAEFQLNRGHLEFLKAIPEMKRTAAQEADLARMEALLAPHGKRRVKTVEEMVRFLESQPSGQSPPGFSMYDSEYRMRSQFLHGTGRGIGLMWNMIQRQRTLKTGLLEMFQELSLIGQYLGMAGWIIAGVQGTPQKRWRDLLNGFEKADDTCRWALNEMYNYHGLIPSEE